jgi:hypothetical protein
MRKGDFEGPSMGCSILSLVGGLATAIALILGLELSAKKLQANPPHFLATPKTDSSTAANPL